MKCPVCGAWNRSTLPVCFSCGAALRQAQQEESWKGRVRDSDHGTQYYRMDQDGEIDAAPDARDELAEEMNALKERKEAGTRRLQQLEETAARRTASEAPPISIHMSPAAGSMWNASAKASAERRRRSGSRTQVVQPAPEEAPAEQPLDASRDAVDPLWAEMAGFDSRRSAAQVVREEKKPRLSAAQKVLRGMIIFLFIALVGLCGYFGYFYFEARQAEARAARKASVVASILDDLAAHTIMIPGEDGSQIYIRELHNSYVVTGGYATIEIADHTWYDSLLELTQETMEVSLTPYLKTASGQQQLLDVITYTIDIPLSPITMVTPDSKRTTVASSMYTMTFEVRPGSTVIVNDKDVSDTVNAETGEFTYNATVHPVGDNSFLIRVRSQYCRENQLQVVLYREKQEIPLDLAADTFTSTSMKQMTVNCTTLPGATVDVLSPHTDLNITELGTTGAFSFIAVFDHIGNNVIHITSSYPGKKPSTIEYTIYYVPSVDIYTGKAWPLNRASDYSELVSNMSARAAATQVYVVMAVCKEIVSEKPQMAIFYTGADGESQPVLLQNYSKTVWKKGTYYRIYADAYGTYNSMPWLNARFTYDH